MISLHPIIYRLLGIRKRHLQPPIKPFVPKELTMKPAPEPGKQKRYFTIGIDFGTHGTKVAYRDVGAGFPDTKVITLDGAGEAKRSPDVFPSLVTVFDERLYFGPPVNGGTIVQNFKMSIGEGATEPGSGLTYEDISVIFLTYVLCSSERRVRHENPEFLCKIMLHLGAPFSDLEINDKRRIAYGRILALVWRLFWRNADIIKQGMLIKEIRDLIIEAKLTNAPSENQWRWLVPETQAVVTTFAQSAEVPPLSYHLVVDVGGFTTDFSLFNVGNYDNPRASIFVSCVIRRAIIDYDRAENRNEFCSSIREELVSAIRNAFKLNLLRPGQFGNFDTKALWKIGGGYYRPDFLDCLLDSTHFLPGYHQLDRNPEFRGNVDRMFLVAKGLATHHHNLVAIVQANPIPIFVPPPDEELPYHLQDRD